MWNNSSDPDAADSRMERRAYALTTEEMQAAMARGRRLRAQAFTSTLRTLFGQGEDGRRTSPACGQPA